MKILYYSSHPYLCSKDPSGYGTHMREVMQAFRDLGHEVLPVIIADDLIAAKGTGSRNKSLASRISSIVPAFVKESVKDYLLLRKDKFYKALLRAQVLKFKPDLIYERASCLQISGVEIATENGVRHVLEVNAPLVDEKEKFFSASLYSKKARELEQRMLQMTSGVVVVSDALKQHLSKCYKIPASKFLITPNAVNPKTLSVSSEKINRIKADLNLDGSLVIGFVGSIFPWHGVDLLLDAFLEIRKDSSLSIRLLIVGDGVGVTQLKKKATASGASKVVVFTGNVSPEEVPNYIACMDITVMAKSNWYGSPVKIFEYGFFGKAIIAPDFKPVTEVMTDGKDGLIVQPTIASLRKALTVLISDSKLRTEIGNNFHKKVIMHHTWTIQAQAILAFSTRENKT